MDSTDYDVMYALDGFEKVWERVNRQQDAADSFSLGEADEKSEPDAENNILAMLEGFLADEASDAAFYTALAGKCSGRTAQTLLRNAADERGHLKKMQLEYFLLSGDCYCPKARTVNIYGVLSALRDSYVREQNGSAEYALTASETDNEALSALFREFSADERRHAQELRRIIERSMG